MTRHKKHGIKLRSMYQWHRYVGISIAIFVIVVAITGIMLNHTGQLALDKKYVQSNWLLEHYGITAPQHIKNYPVKTHWVSQWHEQLYLNTQHIGKTDKNILGAVLYQGMIIIAQDDSLFLYTPEGELIERISGSEGVPSGIEAIGITDNNKLAVNAANGIFTTSNELLFWQKTPSVITLWSGSADLPADLYQKILILYRGTGLNLERVILDLHSGRLLGNWGIYFTDFIALMMIFLASSGFWLWLMRTFKKKTRN